MPRLLFYLFYTSCVLAAAGSVRSQSVPSIESIGNDVIVSAPVGAVRFVAAQGVVIQSNGGADNVDIGASLSTMMSSNVLLTEQVVSLAAAASTAAFEASSINTAQSSLIRTLQSQLAVGDGTDTAQSSLIRTLQSQLADTDSRAVAADHTTAISTLDSQLQAVVNTSNVGFNEIENRLTELEDHVYNASVQRPIFGNINFEGEDGNQADMIGFVGSASTGRFEIINLAPGDRPPGQQPLWAGGGNYTRALRVGQGETAPRITEYEIQSRTVPPTSPWHTTTLCPGNYRMTAWARRSDDYNGRQMIFHNRFFYESGGNVAFTHDQNSGAAIGAFPGSSEWQQISGSVVVRQRAGALNLYIGYPTLNSAGWFDVTGYQIFRLGGPGSC